ncbi:MAG: bifunctional riboflavin kinase/FAD synthetase [Deltaproteobacteria bacterium]|nr:bifunctional riboflavin kinase/FAD synthetase [Deltaproteobacteria bacterium]
MSAKPSVVVPGNHDGVHLGHRELLAAGRRRAREHGEEPGLAMVAMFFDPHPSTVLAPERDPGSLTTATRRTELLLALGADRVHRQHFDRAFANQTPQEFVEQVLVQELGAKSIIIGPDFRFGKNRAGDGEMLAALGSRFGFDVQTAPPLEVDGARVSSTRIRSCLGAGDVGLATTLLGRVPDVTGRVVHGDHRGRTIGFPTANLECEAVTIPADGVYAVVAKRIVAGAPAEAIDTGPLLRGVANLGVRPTFAAGRSVEVHLLDFEGDLYDHTLRIGFVARLRGEQKFEDFEALVAQIGRDADAARELLGNQDREQWQWL